MSGGGSAQKGAGAPLVGRDRDIEFIRSFVNQAAIGGGALLVSGEIGVGKTVLLEAAASYAAAARMRVLRAAGAEFEANVSFAALNQVLFPVFDEIPRLSAVHGRPPRVWGARFGRRCRRESRHVRLLAGFGAVRVLLAGRGGPSCRCLARRAGCRGSRQAMHLVAVRRLRRWPRERR